MKPLTPRKIVITRSREGNAELAPKFEAMGLRVVSMDLLSFISPESWAEVDSRLARLRSFDWLVFTSSTGVRFFAERMRSLGLPLTRGTRPKVGAVGEGTASALSAEGLIADFIPRRYLTRELAEQLPEPAGRVLLLRTDRAEKEMVSTLTSRGFSVEDVVIYRTRVREPQELSQLFDADIVVFGSPSAVEALCSGVPSEVLSRVTARTAACIGPVTAAAARRYRFNEVLEPRLNTFDSLVEKIGEELQLA